MFGTYFAPKKSTSSASLLVGDATITCDKGGKFVIPCVDVLKL